MSKKYLVAIDAGHGMHTEGKQSVPMLKNLYIDNELVRAKGKIIKENEWNRGVSEYLAAALKRCGIDTMFTADMTGKTDNMTGNTDNITDVVISDRSDALHDEGPALFDSEVYVMITEGRYHQVKRMFKAVGCEVTYLERKSMGGLELDDTLRRGEYRKLTAEEINTLLNTLI